jgi:hypothetical protein
MYFGRMISATPIDSINIPCPHRSSHEYLRLVTVREEGKGETVVTTPGRLVYHSRVVDAYHVILDPREGTLIFLNHSLVFTPLPSRVTLDLFDQLNLD